MNEILDELRSTRLDVREIKVTQAQQAAILDEHMRRSEANEKALETSRVEMSILKNFTQKWAGAWTALGVVGTLAAVADAIHRFLSH